MQLPRLHNHQAFIAYYMARRCTRVAADGLHVRLVVLGQQNRGAAGHRPQRGVGRLRGATFPLRAGRSASCARDGR